MNFKNEIKIKKGELPIDSLASKYDALHSITTVESEKVKTFPPLKGGSAIILNKLKNFTGNLLEIGCGRGELLIQSANNYELKVGIDFSEVFLKDAINFTKDYCKEPSKIRWILHDLNKDFPLSNSFFDVVISNATIEHVFDIYNLFNEANRCLKDGGYFIFAIPNIAYIKHRIRLLIGKQPITASSMELWWRDYWDGTHMHYFTLGAVKMLLSQTGFEFIENTGSGRIRFPRLLRPTLFCGDLIVTARKNINI